MKVRITTLLSLTGVLVAGSAAALVNTQVLSSTALRKSTASEISVADTQPPVVPTTGTEVANKFAPLAPNLVPKAATTTFDAAPGGTVVLSSSGGVLTIVSANPADASWAVAQSEVEEGQVEVKFQSATQIVEFKASLVAGQIVTTTEVTDVTAPSVTRPTRSTVSGIPKVSKQPERPHHDQGGKNDGSGDNHSGGSGSDD
jgi:hypothetical protein